ncbi:hypothetical protein [Sulfurimonas sp. HSL3-7]
MITERRGFHFGFEESTLTTIAEKHSFGTITFQIVYAIEKENGRTYPLF